MATPTGPIIAPPGQYTHCVDRKDYRDVPGLFDEGIPTMIEFILCEYLLGGQARVPGRRRGPLRDRRRGERRAGRRGQVGLRRDRQRLLLQRRAGPVHARGLPRLRAAGRRSQHRRAPPGARRRRRALPAGLPAARRAEPDIAARARRPERRTRAAAGLRAAAGHRDLAQRRLRRALEARGRRRRRRPSDRGQQPPQALRPADRQATGPPCPPAATTWRCRSSTASARGRGSASSARR